MPDTKFQQRFEEMKTRGGMVVVFDSQPDKPLLCKPVALDDFTILVDIDNEDVSKEVMDLLKLINKTDKNQTTRAAIFKHSVRMVL